MARKNDSPHTNDLFSGRWYEELPNGRWKWTCWDRGRQIGDGTADTRQDCDAAIDNAFCPI